jgi:hypothetical protein
MLCVADLNLFSQHDYTGSNLDMKKVDAESTIEWMFLPL